jgi:hydroxymethylcytosylglucuronate/cytosylglucuronate synthase
MVESGPVIAVSAVDFGWGSAGKLDAILGAITASGTPIRVVVLGSALGRSVLSDVTIEAWYEQWPRGRAELRDMLMRHGVAVALIILDAEAATRIQDAGTPCVYVDSLPYLWTDADPLPTTVSAYCAQMPLSSSVPCSLADVDNLVWVGPIVKASRSTPRDPGMAVVNVGGLHSPGFPSGNPTYLRLVLPAVLRALSLAGVGEIHVCGNVDEEGFREASYGAQVASVGARSHDRFLELVSRAAVLVTSPGLTTLLEAMDGQTPTVCMPPQNISQILNAEQYASAAGSWACVGWPTGVLYVDAIDDARAEGELVALKVMADALDAADSAELQAPLTQALFASISRAWSGGALVHHPAEGRDGAREVAAIVCGLAGL